MKRDRRERGQAILEFALAMPFLLMFMLFTIDLALLGYSYVGLSNAVREGARCGAVGATDAAIEARVIDTAGGAGEVTSVNASSPRITGGDIVVTADYSYDWFTPVGLVPGLSGTLDFSKDVTMRMETDLNPAKTSCP